MGQFDDNCTDKLSTTGEGGIVCGRPVQLGDELPMVKEDNSVETEDDSSKLMEDDSIEGRMERKFERMMEGRKAFSDLRAPDKPPPWLNKEVSQCVSILMSKETGHDLDNKVKQGRLGTWVHSFS